jgi:hypothetical protein
MYHFSSGSLRRSATCEAGELKKARWQKPSALRKTNGGAESDAKMYGVKEEEGVGER